MEEDNFTEIELRLRQISLLIAHQILFTHFPQKTQTEKIIFLSEIGFDYHDIAKIVGAAPNTVSVRISEYRKKKNGKKTKKGNTPKSD